MKTINLEAFWSVELKKGWFPRSFGEYEFVEIMGLRVKDSDSSIKIRITLKDFFNITGIIRSELNQRKKQADQNMSEFKNATNI